LKVSKLSRQERPRSGRRTGLAEGDRPETLGFQQFSKKIRKYLTNLDDLGTIEIAAEVSAQNALKAVSQDGGL